jgi:hypothetical protein
MFFLYSETRIEALFTLLPDSVEPLSRGFGGGRAGVDRSSLVPQ